MIPSTTDLPGRAVPDVDDLLRLAARQGVRFVRLRRSVQLHEEHLLLVAREDLIPLGDIAWSHGLRHRSPRGRTPITYGFDRGPGRGSILVTATHELRYGAPIPCLATKEREDLILRRARLDAGIPVATPADELVDTLLHCLLHIESFTPQHQARLTEIMMGLRREPPSAGAAAERVQSELAPALTWSALLSDIVQSRWDALLARRKDIRHRLFLHAPARSAFRWAWRASGADRLGGPEVAT